MNRTMKHNLVVASVFTLIIFVAANSSFATPSYPDECGSDGCHVINDTFTMSSNSTGNATLGIPFTLRINATKLAGGPGFWLALKADWADNDQFNFTPTAILDNSAEDLTATLLLITYDFTFIPESVGNYTIRAWCATKNWANSIDIPINVTEIPDETPPTIDSPSDIAYDVATTGHSITWSPFDERPSEFTIQRNGTVVLSGGWGGNQIVINVDYLSPGVHEYNITVIDTSGHAVSDVVIVTVNGELPTTPTSTTETTIATTTETTTTTSGGNPGVPGGDNNEVLVTASFSLIMLAMIGFVGILSFLLIADRFSLLSQIRGL
jgi:hypothetical protein